MENGSPFKGRFTKIANLSDKRRFPRLGKIRLGVKAVSIKSGKEYPKEVDYFVCPPEVEKVYGPNPKELDIMFPVDDHEVIFPQAYKHYGSSKGLKCIGNGQEAMWADEKTGEMASRECPCELLGKGCAKRAHLMFILPKINLGGVYQCDIGSFNSIIDINSGLDYTRALIGRFAMIPLTLRRMPKETHFEGNKQIHYTLQLNFNGDINLLNDLRENTKKILSETTRNLLPAPIDENPVLDAEARIVRIQDEESLTPDKPVEVPAPAVKAPAPAIVTVEKPKPDDNISKELTVLDGLYDRCEIARKTMGQDEYNKVLGMMGFESPQEMKEKQLNEFLTRLTMRRNIISAEAKRKKKE